MPRPHLDPVIGRQLASTARAVSRAFDRQLAAAGGSLPTWLVLLTLKTQQVANQRELAAGVGIQGATLTHHLNGMEQAGLLTRRRDPANRRVHLVELTEQGDAAFRRMRQAASGFDQQLRAGLDADEIGRLSELLTRLRDNIDVERSRPKEPADAGGLTPKSDPVLGAAAVGGPYAGSAACDPHEHETELSEGLPR